MERAHHPDYCGIVEIHYCGDHYCPLTWTLTFTAVTHFSEGEYTIGGMAIVMDMQLASSKEPITNYFPEAVLEAVSKEILAFVITKFDIPVT